MFSFDNFVEEVLFVIQWRYNLFAFQALALVFALDGFDDLVELQNRMEYHSMPKK